MVGLFRIAFHRCFPKRFRQTSFCQISKLHDTKSCEFRFQTHILFLKIPFPSENN